VKSVTVADRHARSARDGVGGVTFRAADGLCDGWPGVMVADRGRGISLTSEFDPLVGPARPGRIAQRHADGWKSPASEEGGSYAQIIHRICTG